MRSVSVEVAIIGAGTAGCFIASLLDEAGVSCRLLEKSRGLGGRCSRRRIDDNYSVDLGAPEFAMNADLDPVLLAKQQAWIRAGFVSAWQRPSACFDAIADTQMQTTLCATPSMNTWHKQIAGHIDTLTGSRVQRLQKSAGRWQLLDADGQVLTEADKVIVTSPAEQAYDLLKEFAGFAECKTVADASLAQYVCAVGFSQPLNLSADIYRGGHPLLHTAIRESSKPARGTARGFAEVWMLHSTYAAAQHDSPDALIEAFCQHFAIEQTAQVLTSHYWRLSRHDTTVRQGQPFIWNDELQIGCCADWLDSGDMQGALNSSLQLFRAIHPAQ